MPQGYESCERACLALPQISNLPCRIASHLLSLSKYRDLLDLRPGVIAFTYDFAFHPGGQAIFYAFEETFRVETGELFSFSFFFFPIRAFSIPFPISFLSNIKSYLRFPTAGAFQKRIYSFRYSFALSSRPRSPRAFHRLRARRQCDLCGPKLPTTLRISL